MDINNGYDRWLTTPPDEPEQEYCETCGQEMEYTECDNPFCPDKFEINAPKVVHKMAEHLVEVEQELLDLKVEYQQLKNITLMQRSLTLGQPNVVRDTEYAIKMMQDAIDYAINELPSGEDDEPLTNISKEWNEVKKILQGE